MLFLIIISTFLIIATPIQCGPGVPILTRIPQENGTFNVEYQCLCPIDYFGIQCHRHRRIKCYLETKQIVPAVIDQNNYKENTEFQMKFSAECYLQQDNQDFISFVNFYLKKEIEGKNYEYQMEIQGYGQIIWANNTSLLTEDGHLIYQEGYPFSLDQNGNRILSKQDQSKILNSFEPFKFKYSSQFLGFPLTESNIYVSTNIYHVLQQRNSYFNESAEIINYQDYIKVVNDTLQKQAEVKEYANQFDWNEIDFQDLSFQSISEQIFKITDQYKNISVKIDILPEIKCRIKANLMKDTEYGLLRAQIRLQETYNSNKQHNFISVNSAKVMIPVRVPGVGKYSPINSNFYKAPARIIYFILIAIAIGLAYIAVKYYRSYNQSKKREIQGLVEASADDLSQSD